MSTYSPIPSCPTVKLRPKGEHEPELEYPCSEAPGSLMPLASMTRPDTHADTIRTVVKFTNDPGFQHWNDMLKILAYMTETHDFGLSHKWGSVDRLSAYANS